MKARRTWVVVCDDRIARIMENAGVGAGLTEIAQMHAAREKDEDPDRPGRERAAPGMARHAVGLPADADAVPRAEFAARIAQRLEAIVQSARTGDRIGLVAAPRMLGALRQALPAGVTERVAFEVDKDLVKLDPDAIAEHLQDVAAF